MKLILDTQVVLWWLGADRRLGRDIADIIETTDDAVFVSVVSLWEIVIKSRIGKLDADVAKIERALGANAIEQLAIESRHLQSLSTLTAKHKDPFDHMIVAQALAEDAILVSYDKVIRTYPLRLLPSVDVS